MVTLSLVLLIAATVLSGISVFKAAGRSELPWACLCLSLVLLLPRMG